MLDIKNIILVQSTAKVGICVSFFVQFKRPQIVPRQGRFCHARF